MKLPHPRSFPRPLTHSFRLTASLLLTALAPAFAAPGVEAIVDEILARHPELAFYRAEIAAAQSGVRVATAPANPELAAQAGHRRTRDSAGVLAGEGTAWSVSLLQTFEWPGRLPLRKSIANRLVYAVGKARAVAPRFTDRAALLLAADQTPEIDGHVLRKASTPGEAQAQLERLAGREHALHTATVLLDTETGRLEHVLTTIRLRMRALTPAQIARYVAADAPIGSAGGYTLEGLGVTLFEAIDGQDDSAIVGLPLIAVTALLARFGIDPLGSP